MLREKLVSVKIGYSTRSIKAYSALVRTYLTIPGLYIPESVDDEDLVRYITKHYFEKG